MLRLARCRAAVRGGASRRLSAAPAARSAVGHEGAGDVAAPVAVGDDVTTSAFPGAPGVPFTQRLDVRVSDERVPIYRVLDLEGRPIDPAYDAERHGEELLVRVYETMLTLSALDGVFYDAQRQGRLSFYMTSTGEEASTVASAAAIDNGDMVFSQYREAGAFLWRGFDLEMIADQCLSNVRDLGKGRAMPVHYGSSRLNLQTVSSPLTTQLPHAVGCAYAFKRAGKKNVAMCYFGEGAASEGDAHAAFNFAATLRCPVIFYARNNSFAISTPASEQFRGDGIASRAAGYGMHVVRCDANDVLAVLDTVTEARRIALEQNVPVMVEAMSYRVGHHSTSDDSTRYRGRDEIKYWSETNNPMTRTRKFLESRGWWDSDRESTTRQRLRKTVLEELARAEKEKKPAMSEVFTDVYADIPPHLRKQQEELAEHLAEFGDKYGLDMYAK